MDDGSRWSSPDVSGGIAQARRRQPLYPKVIAGDDGGPHGEDARALAEWLAAMDGGSWRSVNVGDGSAAEELARLARVGEADLIVLGATHRARIGSTAPRSVAEHLLRLAGCPLLIAPSGYAKEDHSEDWFRVVAVGWDRTPEAQAALAEASSVADRFSGAMRVIGVAPPPAQPHDGVHVAPSPSLGTFQSSLHDAVRELPSELRALPVMERGDPASRLIEQAHMGVDLLVVGSRRHGSLARLLLGAVSSRVVREAPCPVLVAGIHP